MIQFADQFFGPNFPQAKCKDITDKDMFYPEGGEGLDEALRPLLEMCGSCPHKVACLEFALGKNDLEGIWGGTTPGMRRETLRKKNLGKGKGATIRTSRSRIEIVVKKKKEGLSNPLIGELLGIDESSVRHILKLAKERKLL